MLSPCFRSCCDSEESSYKKGAFVPVEENNEARHSRGYIPWTWSRKFHLTYQLGAVLGSGTFGVVHEATLVEPPHKSYAVKVLQRNRMNSRDIHNFNNEVHILLDLKHDNIIRLYELYKTPHYFFLVLEKLNGGELFDRLCEKEFYSEMDARNICRTIFEAIAYCHDHKVAHRDLKPENLLLVSRLDDSAVKVADFGFSKRVPRPNCLRTVLGSPAFVAPEIINYQPYDERADNWSLGVIVYSIIGGYNPFQQDTVHLTHQQIRQANYRFHPEVWDGISRDAKSLIKGLLTKDPEQRLTVQDALLQPWMTGRGTDLRRNNPVNLQRLKIFNMERKKNKNERSVSMYWLLTRR